MQAFGSLLPVLNQGDHLCVRLANDALPIHFYNTVPWMDRNREAVSTLASAEKSECVISVLQNNDIQLPFEIVNCVCVCVLPVQRPAPCAGPPSLTCFTKIVSIGSSLLRGLPGNQKSTSVTSSNQHTAVNNLQVM